MLTIIEYISQIHLKYLKFTSQIIINKKILTSIQRYWYKIFWEGFLWLGRTALFVVGQVLPCHPSSGAVLLELPLHLYCLFLWLPFHSEFRVCWHHLQGCHQSPRHLLSFPFHLKYRYMILKYILFLYLELPKKL